MTSCYIVSNRVQCISTLSEFINRTAFLQFSGHSTDPISATNEIMLSKPTITFLDIGQDAMQWMELIDMICLNTHVVFIPGTTEIALSLYTRFTTDFMLEPLSYINFIRVVTKSQHIISNHSGHVMLPDSYSFYITEEKGRLVRILYNDILFVQGAQNYIRIQLTDDYYLIYLSLKEMEKELPVNHFVRVHKSFIVNIHKIKSIEWNRILFQHHPAVTIGETYKQKFMEIIGQRMISARKNSE